MQTDPVVVQPLLDRLAHVQASVFSSFCIAMVCERKRAQGMTFEQAALGPQSTAACLLTQLKVEEGSPCDCSLTGRLTLVHGQVKDKPKSMLAAKSFEPINDMAAMDRWIAIMADELANRMADDYEQHLRRPRNLIIHYRSGLPAMLLDTVLHGVAVSAGMRGPPGAAGMLAGPVKWSVRGGG